MTGSVAIGSTLPSVPGLDMTEDPTVPVDIEEIYNGTTFEWQGNITLNPEMVLHMVRRRLKDLDEQISSATNQIESNTARSERLARQQEVLQAIKGRAAEQDATEAGDTFSINGEMIKIGDETMLASAWLESVGLDPTHYPDSTTIGELDATIQNLKSIASRVNSGNEMLMLQIQTLTQQRSQSIQLGTSLIKKIDEGSMSIARNI